MEAVYFIALILSPVIMTFGVVGGIEAYKHWKVKIKYGSYRIRREYSEEWQIEYFPEYQTNNGEWHFLKVEKRPYTNCYDKAYSAIQEHFKAETAKRTTDIFDLTKDKEMYPKHKTETKELTIR